MKYTTCCHCEERSDEAIPRILIAVLLFLIASTQLAHASALRHVERVIDGDTIVLDGGERVRLIGIDTPEVHHPREPVQCYGSEASDYLKQRLEGQDVYLKYQEEKTDKYGRTLAFVYLGKDLINMEMVKAGLAFAYTRFPFKYEQIFVRVQDIAKKKRLGLWDVCVVECTDVCKTNPETIPPSPLEGEGRGEGSVKDEEAI